MCKCIMYNAISQAIRALANHWLPSGDSESDDVLMCSFANHNAKGSVAKSTLTPQLLMCILV